MSPLYFSVPCDYASCACLVAGLVGFPLLRRWDNGALPTRDVLFYLRYLAQPYGSWLDGQVYADGGQKGIRHTTPLLLSSLRIPGRGQKLGLALVGLNFTFARET